jgi:hypothetical protein
MIAATILSIVLASPTCAGDQPVYSLEALAHLSWDELEQIYRQAEPGCRPDGFVRGRAIYRSSDFLAGPRSRVANFFWRGKHFSSADDMLINQWRGGRMIRAHVSSGQSWLDGRPAQILDYQNTSRVWSDVRDEMREVSPGVYVGAMFLRRCPQPRLKTLFILEAAPCPE